MLSDQKSNFKQKLNVFDKMFINLKFQLFTGNLTKVVPREIATKSFIKTKIKIKNIKTIFIIKTKKKNLLSSFLKGIRGTGASI